MAFSILSFPWNISCGHWDGSEFSGRSVSPVRTVTKFEIEYYLDDALTTTADGIVYPIRKDHIQIAKPGQVRFGQLPFTTMFLKFSADGALAETLLRTPHYFCARHPQKITALLEELITLNEMKTRNDLLFYARLFEVLNIILSDSEIPAEQSSKNFAIATRAKQFMDQHYAEPITLEEIAASVNFSRTYFHNLFTGCFQITPHEYLLERRISAAKKLLWDPSISLGEIAERCGFGCPQYFSKAFKKESGLTPGQYRKNFLQNYLK